MGSMQLRETYGNFEQNRTEHPTSLTILAERTFVCRKLFFFRFQEKLHTFRQCYYRGFFSLCFRAVIWRLMLNTRWGISTSFWYSSHCIAGGGGRTRGLQLQRRCVRKWVRGLYNKKQTINLKHPYYLQIRFNVHNHWWGSDSNWASE